MPMHGVCIADQGLCAHGQLHGKRREASCLRPRATPLSLVACVCLACQVGSARLSTEEARSHFAAWCVASAPLVLGHDLTDKAASARANPIVGNANAIAVNQAWFGHAGRVVSAAAETFDAPTAHGAAGTSGPNTTFPLWQIWSKRLRNESRCS